MSKLCTSAGHGFMRRIYGPANNAVPDQLLEHLDVRENGGTVCCGIHHLHSKACFEANVQQETSNAHSYEPIQCLP